jgi:hypothetical protein
MLRFNPDLSALLRQHAGRGRTDITTAHVHDFAALRGRTRRPRRARPPSRGHSRRSCGGLLIHLTDPSVPTRLPLSRSSRVATRATRWAGERGRSKQSGCHQRGIRTSQRQRAEGVAARRAAASRYDQQLRVSVVRQGRVRCSSASR